MPLAANDVAVVDGPAKQSACARADDGAERLRISGSDDVAEDATGDAPDDQAGGAIVAPAVITIVRATVDPIASTESTRSIPAIVAPVVAGCIPVLVPRLVTVFTTVPSIFAPVAAIFTPIPAVFPAVAFVFAPIPPIFVTIPASVALRLCRHGRYGDKCCKQ
jgi:hypothetical protein